MSKKQKKKEGAARLMELAGTKKGGLTAACTLAVMSSVFRIIPYFTIYSILKKLIKCYSEGSRFTFGAVSSLVMITAASAVLYGVCAYASAMLSHGAAFDIIVLDKGRIIERGNHEQLLAIKGRYAELWKEQQTAGSWKIA